MVAALGGPVDFCDYPDRYLPRAPVVKPLYAEKDGWIASMQTRNIGLSIIGLKAAALPRTRNLTTRPAIPTFAKSAITSMPTNRWPLFMPLMRRPGNRPPQISDAA